MKKLIRRTPRLAGTLELPGDKSISQRAILLNSIAKGTAHVSNLCEGDDRTSILSCMRGLGVAVREHYDCSVSNMHECFEITGCGFGGLSEPLDVLDAGNSGTAVRLITGLLSGQPFFSVITGDESLRSRPMGRVIEPLRLMGAEIVGRDNDSRAPLAVKGGNLTGIEFRQPIASAQVKSSILIAGLFAKNETTVVQPSLSRDHTELMLGAMGAEIDVDRLRVTVKESELASVNLSIPGDISGAAFWIVAGCIHPDACLKLSGVGINPTRSGVIQLLREMGARISLENPREQNGEPVSDIIVESSQLQGVEIGGDVIPRVIDELPVIAVAASIADGQTIIRDAAELRVKESDRIGATVEGLKRLGAIVEEREDGMVIQGTGMLYGSEVDSFGDHRIAMAMAIAGLVSEGETTIVDAEVAGVSYPGFWDDLQSISLGGG